MKGLIIKVAGVLVAFGLVSSAFGQAVVGGTPLKCDGNICPEVATGGAPIQHKENVDAVRNAEPAGRVMKVE
jgi:hypothetical protein